MADKGIRLSKAAREVNLGIQHVAEFLASKGHDVEAKPNTKLSGQMYEMLLDEFQADREIKKVSEAKTISEPVEHETVAIRTVAARAERAARKAEAVVAPPPPPAPTPVATPEPVAPAPPVHQSHQHHQWRPRSQLSQ